MKIEALRQEQLLVEWSEDVKMKDCCSSSENMTKSEKKTAMKDGKQEGKHAEIKHAESNIAGYITAGVFCVLLIVSLIWAVTAQSGLAQTSDDGAIEVSEGACSSGLLTENGEPINEGDVPLGTCNGGK